MGVGDSWGTREELLHPRDSKGRFRSKWKMSTAAMDRVLKVLSTFSPKTWPSDQDAATYLGGLSKKSSGKKLPLDNWSKMQADIRAGKSSPDLAAYKAAEQPLPEDLILTSVMDAKAFGLTPETLPQIEEYSGNLVANKGPTSTNVGTPVGPGQVTLSIAAPKGTMAVIPGGGSREVILSEGQPLRITKVKPDGKGGFYVYATAMPKGSKGDTRTKKLGTRAPTPTDPDGDGVPGVADPNAPQVPGQVPSPGAQPGQVPGAPAGKGAPRTEEIQSPSVGGDGPTPDAPAAPAEPAPEAPSTPTPTPGTPEPGPTDKPTVEAVPEGQDLTDFDKEVQRLAAEELAKRIEARAEGVPAASEGGAPAEASPEDRVAARLLERIGEIDPAVRDQIMADMSPGDRTEVDAALERVNAAKVAKKAAPAARSDAEVDRDIAKAERRKKAETREAVRPGSGAARKEAQEKAAVRNAETQQRLADEVDTEVRAIVQELGHELPDDQVLKTAIGLTDAQVKGGRLTRSAAGRRMRELAQGRGDAEKQLLLDFADSIEMPGPARAKREAAPKKAAPARAKREAAPKKAAPAKAAPAKAAPAKAAPAKAVVPEPQGKPIPDKVRADLFPTTLPELRQIAREEGIKIPASIKRKADIADYIKSQRSGGDKTPAKAAPATPNPSASTMNPEIAGRIARTGQKFSLELDENIGAELYELASAYEAGEINDQGALEVVRKLLTQARAEYPKGVRSLRELEADIRRLARKDTPPPAKKDTPPPAKKVTPPAGPKPGTVESTKPIRPNGWGGTPTPGRHHYHEDGKVGIAIDTLGADARLDVRGEPLANRLGQIATDATLGRISAQEQVDRIKALAAELPEGSRVRRSVDNLARSLDAPPVPAAQLPDDTPKALRDLVDDLAQVPLVRQNLDIEYRPLLKLIDDFDTGVARPTRLAMQVRDLANRHHESEEGKAEVDRAFIKALRALEDLGLSELRRIQIEKQQRRDREAGKLAEGDVVVQATPKSIPQVVEAPPELAEAIRKTTIAQLREQATAEGIDVPVELRTKQEIMAHITQVMARREVGQAPLPTKAVKGKTTPKEKALRAVDLAPVLEGIDPDALSLMPGLVDELARNLADPKKSPRQVRADMLAKAQRYMDSRGIEAANGGTAVSPTERAWIEAVRLIHSRLEARGGGRKAIELAPFLEGIGPEVIARDPEAIERLRSQLAESKLTPRRIAEDFLVYVERVSNSRALAAVLNPESVDPEEDSRKQAWVTAMRDVADRIAGYRKTPPPKKGSTSGADIDESMFKQRSVDGAISHRGKAWKADTWSRPGLTERENSAVMAYTHPVVATVLNRALRDGKVTPSVESSIRDSSMGRFTFESLRDALDRAIASSSLRQDTELWRGTFMTEEDLARLIPGMKVKHPKFLSTASMKQGVDDVMRLWQETRPEITKGKRLVYHKILAPKGTNAVGGAGAVHEVLLGRDLGTDLVRIEPGDPPTLVWRIG